ISHVTPPDLRSFWRTATSKTYNEWCHNELIYCFLVYEISSTFISLPPWWVPYVSIVWVLLSTIFQIARCHIRPPPGSGCEPLSVMVLPSALDVPSIMKIPVPIVSIHAVTYFLVMLSYASIPIPEKGCPIIWALSSW